MAPKRRVTANTTPAVSAWESHKLRKECEGKHVACTWDASARKGDVTAMMLRLLLSSKPRERVAGVRRSQRKIRE